MNFTDVCSIVQDMTKRPDKINSIRKAVNSAVTFFSLDNMFQRDYMEQQLSLDASQFSQAFALSALTRFRKFKFLRPTGTMCYLSPIADSDIVKHCNLQNKYYIIGENVNINLSATASKLDVGYYTFPPLLNDTDAGKTYWLLDIAPYMIIDRAASEVFREIGEEKSSQLLRLSAAESYTAVRKDLGTSTT